MDVEPPTGDDLNRMLVSMKRNVLRRAAEEPQAHRRPWARRHLGLTLGLVALLGVGGAGGALALGLPSSFRAGPVAAPSERPSTSTSTSTPTPTVSSPPPAVPAQPEQPAEPSSGLALSCSELGARIGVTGIGLSAEPDGPGTLRFTAEQAAERQAGVRSCGWSGSGLGEGAHLSVMIAPAGDRGREWISGLARSGLDEYGVGDVSAFTCEAELVSGCNTTFVVGPWWVETNNWDLQTPYAYDTDPERLRPVAAALAETLAGEAPGPAWPRPETSWSTTTCDDLSTADVAGAVGTPELLGPRDQTFASSGRGIRQTQISTLVCDWSARTEAGLPGTVDQAQVDRVVVHVTPGSGWAFGTETDAGDPVAVAGADAASWSCAVDTYGQDLCVLDVLVDDTWVQLMALTPSGDVGRSRAAVVVAAAEQVLAAQAASSGRG